uniref:(northern house mosquito) hypothetical protein n=1 Tax=Culex pipiens TaxID=7175 RepID=A0A8D8ARW2_CULPI
MDRCLAVPLHPAQLHLHDRCASSSRQRKAKIFTRGKLLLPAMMYCRFHEQQLFRKIERKFSSSSASFAVIKHLKHSSEKFHCRWSVARYAKGKLYFASNLTSKLLIFSVEDVRWKNLNLRL